ncbi:MAG: hypothetical protein WD295_04330 [Bacteroidota bacterium]
MKSLALLRLTFRESLLKGTLLFYFAVGTAILLLFAIGIRAPADPNAGFRLFGLDIPDFAIGETVTPAVDFFLINVHNSASSAIMLFGVFATAGLIPSMLEKGTAELFLSKPLHRFQILLMRSVGAVAGIGANILWFSGGVWLIFGLKVGVWHWGYLGSAVAMTYAFLSFFSIVALLGVVTRSAGFTVMFAFAFTFFSSALENRGLFLDPLWESPFYRAVLDGMYYLTPQLSGMMSHAALLIGSIPTPRGPEQFSLEPFAFSFASSFLLYALSCWYFSRRDF